MRRKFQEPVLDDFYPLRLEECIVPDRLSEWQWVDLFGERGYEKLVRTLKSLGEDLEPP